MAQAMEKGRVIELLEYYKDIDGEVSIYRRTGIAAAQK